MSRAPTGRPSLTRATAPLSDLARGRAVFAGALLHFRDLPAVYALGAYADRAIRAALETADPPAAQHALPAEDYVARIHALQKPFRRDAAACGLFEDVLTAVGADPARTFFDWLHLRALPDGTSHTSRATRATGPHRDTWGSAVMQQTNWWMPIYPITDGRTIALYPDYWDLALANTSADWQFEKARTYRRTAPAVSAEPAYPTIPEPAEPVDRGREFRAVIEPGDVLCFSGAQLHATVPNRTGLARFSLEVRTVCLDDVLGGRGAPNIDGHQPRPRYEWFRRVTDRAPLVDVLADADHSVEN